MDPRRPDRPVVRRQPIEAKALALVVPRIAPRFGGLDRDPLDGEGVSDGHAASREDLEELPLRTRTMRASSRPPRGCGRRISCSHH